MGNSLAPMVVLDSELEQGLERIAGLLQRRHWHLVTAESCTGGWISAAITALPGSSQWFEQGFVVYANRAKTQILKVGSEIIDGYGAVSSEVLEAMLTGALQQSKAEVALAVTGIAGPGGGTDTKPVGTVWFGVQHIGSSPALENRCFEGNRQQIRWQTVQAVVQLLERVLEQSVNLTKHSA